MTGTPKFNGKRVTVLFIVFALTCMTALTAGAVPLYRLFCQVTGYGGTTSTAAVAPGAADDAQFVTVRFNADTARGMPWEFKPMRLEVKARLGEQITVFYEASNPTDRAITGTSTYNVTPLKVGEYFAKIDCFCFTEQLLAPGAQVAMPVTFFVDPELVIDPETSEVRTITLSYTFFEMVGAETTTNAALETSAGAVTN
ncbi:MAG: cytochrome c oxidase assembly protein [Alphaproteobacteria bacterium]|jgi:cytochrome c oxidase assembly protein subunit 11|nr:cytochrome c oxidase assembly protein [Rhodospirillaceae bacterium]MDG2482184.1 cytochrome c oxidase assembly protein [Alphaproteobacteria bacterium]MBT6203808.1 cytochrome c oxidase assembly protein [Rhodospirillaceae bacterium]MBT6509548.1 cytochrome c oxidase assembly protein [Rhodospirillaceae bacterium]MBT7615145.1 cytochrome c oxidase assembly protein [Rhodospirillaceae bacterium]